MRTAINFTVDCILLGLLAGVVWTGLVMRYVLPPGFRGCYGWTLWGLGRHDYGTIHYGLSVLMVLFSGIHLGLHWRWFCAKLNARVRTRGQSLIALLLVLFLFGLCIGSVFFLHKQVCKPNARPAAAAAEPGEKRSFFLIPK